MCADFHDVTRKEAGAEAPLLPLQLQVVPEPPWRSLAALGTAVPFYLASFHPGWWPLVSERPRREP